MECKCGNKMELVSSRNTDLGNVLEKYKCVVCYRERNIILKKIVY